MSPVPNEQITHRAQFDPVPSLFLGNSDRHGIGAARVAHCNCLIAHSGLIYQNLELSLLKLCLLQASFGHGVGDCSVFDDGATIGGAAYGISTRVEEKGNEDQADGCNSQPFHSESLEFLRRPENFDTTGKSSSPFGECLLRNGRKLCRGTQLSGLEGVHTTPFCTIPARKKC